MPPKWREKVFEFESPGTGRCTILWPASWGGHYDWSSRYPLDQDYSLVRRTAEIRRKGGYPSKSDGQFIDDWVRKVMAHPGKLEFRDSEAYVRGHVQFSFNVAQMQHGAGGGKILFYSAASAPTDLLPENRTHEDEWQYRKCMHSSASFVDYAVWYADKMIQQGLDGIYVDNAYPMPKFTWPTGEGYVGDDGEVHPSLGSISRTRALVRRLAVMMHQKKRQPYVRVHMTNAAILPVLSFAQASLGWEWKYGKTDFQDRFTPGYVRAVNIGRQAGTIPNVLGGVTGVPANSPEEIRLTRTALAMTLPHEIFPYSRVHAPTAVAARDIVYGFIKGRQVQAFPYWQNRSLVSGPDNLLVTAYKADKRLLLVVGNMGGEGDYELRLDALAAGGQVAAATNRETGQDVKVKLSTLHLSIKKHDLALIEVVLK